MIQKAWAINTELESFLRHTVKWALPLIFTETYILPYLSLVFLLISNLTNGLHLHQFLGTKTTEANKSLETDANGAY